MLLAFGAPSSSYSTRIYISFLYRTNRIVAGLLQSIQIITNTWSVSASCQSTLFKPKALFNCIASSSTGVTHRNTLLNDSDDRCFVSQTCFHCQFYCLSLCVQLVTSADIGAGLRKHFTGSTLIAYFTKKS